MGMQQAAATLYYLLDLSVADVAKAMGRSEGTVRAQLHNARHSLRVTLREEPTHA